MVERIRAASLYAGTVIEIEGQIAGSGGASAWARANPISRRFGSFRSDSSGHYRIIVPAGSYFAFAHKFSDLSPRAAASGTHRGVAAFSKSAGSGTPGWGTFGVMLISSLLGDQRSGPALHK